MHCKPTDYPYEVRLEETEEGYAVHFKGDKEKLRAKLEAFEAFQNFRGKAKAAGLGHCHGRWGHREFLAMIHKHIQSVHRNRYHCTENASE